jgi:hypothetical protein
MLIGLVAIVAGAFTVITGAAMLAGFVPLKPVMVAVVVEMPGGETIFGAPRQPERPSPHRTVDG